MHWSSLCTLLHTQTTSQLELAVNGGKTDSTPWPVRPINSGQSKGEHGVTAFPHLPFSASSFPTWTQMLSVNYMLKSQWVTVNMHNKNWHTAGQILDAISAFHYLVNWWLWVFKLFIFTVPKILLWTKERMFSSDLQFILLKLHDIWYVDCREILKLWPPTRCQIVRLKCIKFDFGSPDPAEGAYSAAPDSLLLRGRKGRRGVEGGSGKGRERDGNEVSVWRPN